MTVWDFLTSATSPWWTTLVATIIGGLLTWLVTRSSMKAQAKVDEERTKAEREHQTKAEWRRELLDTVSDLTATHHEYFQTVHEARMDLRRELGDIDDYQDVDSMWENSDVFEKAEVKLYPLNSRLLALTSKLSIISSGDIAEAAWDLTKADSKFKPWNSRDDFKKNAQKAEVTLAMLLSVAQRDLSLELDEPTGAIDDARELL